MAKIRHAGLILLSLLLVYINVFSQENVKLSDGKHTIDLKKGMRIAYLEFGDTMKMTKNYELKVDETSRYGTVFRADSIIGLDSSSIILQSRRVSYDSIRVIYANNSYLPIRIGGAVLMAGSAYLILSTIDTKNSTQNENDLSRIWSGIGGVLIGSFLSFHNFNHAVQCEFPNHLKVFF